MANTQGKWKAIRWESVIAGTPNACDDGDVFEVVADGRRVAEYLTEADAKLCAAAPQLREIVRSFLDDFANLTDTQISTNYGMSALMRVRRARAAIAACA